MNFNKLIPVFKFLLTKSIITAVNPSKKSSIFSIFNRFNKYLLINMVIYELSNINSLLTSKIKL